LAIEERSNGNFVTSDLFANGFERQVLLLLCVEKGWRGRREAGDEILLMIC
jgi:hypothetical protein